jgi:hypothetical protein
MAWDENDANGVALLCVVKKISSRDQKPSQQLT